MARKVALVTGAGTGIGRAVALALAMRCCGEPSSLDFASAFGRGLSCPGRGRGFGTSTYSTSRFGSGSRLRYSARHPTPESDS